MTTSSPTAPVVCQKPVGPLRPRNPGVVEVSSRSIRSGLTEITSLAAFISSACASVRTAAKPLNVTL